MLTPTTAHAREGSQARLALGQARKCVAAAASDGVFHARHLLWHAAQNRQPTAKASSARSAQGACIVLIDCEGLGAERQEWRMLRLYSLQAMGNAELGCIMGLGIE